MVAAPDPRLGEHACAFVRVDAGAAGAELALPGSGHISRPRASVDRNGPKSCGIVDDLPRTPSGKVRKADLRRQLREEAASS